MFWTELCDTVGRQAYAFDRELSQRRVNVVLVRACSCLDGLFLALGLRQLYAQTIRPDDLTVLRAADAVHKGSVKTIDMGRGKVGWVESWDSVGFTVVDWQYYRTRKLCPICNSSRQWQRLFGGSHHQLQPTDCLLLEHRLGKGKAWHSRALGSRPKLDFSFGRHLAGR